MAMLAIQALWSPQDFPVSQEEKYSLDLFMCIYVLKIELYLIYNVMLVSGVQQSDSLFWGVVFHFKFLQNEAKFLCAV